MLTVKNPHDEQVFPLTSSLYHLNLFPVMGEDLAYRKENLPLSLPFSSHSLRYFCLAVFWGFHSFTEQIDLILILFSFLKP